MSAAEAVRIVAETLGVKRSEVIEALVYNLVIEQIGEQVQFLRTGETTIETTKADSTEEG